MQTPVHVERADVTGGTDMRTRHGPNYSPGFAWMSTDLVWNFCLARGRGARAVSEQPQRR
ncbi:MAG: hypothetical protein QOK38_2658 [Acidobacteriaceae bacterium]|jgi:hypothetical protein|nr:hypothetical protein [Acidobacteriaceae bacterium]